MAASIQRRRLSWFLAATIVACLTRGVSGQEPGQATRDAEVAPPAAEAVETLQGEPAVARAADKSSARPAHLIVLRLPITTLATQIDRQIDFQVPVRDVILGTPVRGVARLVG